MHKYKFLGKKGEGTFSEVVKAQVVKTGKYVAIKRMKASFDTLDKVNNLREIQALRRLSPNANIVKLLEVLYDRATGRLALVFELLDANLYELIRGRRTNLPAHRVKSYMYQLIKSLDHMHRNGIFHRDIKPENILIRDETKLKLADFGSCRGIYSKQPYTEYISTRWYRAPECLLTDGYYNYKMDIWGIGCVFFEIITRYPLFPGKDELDQVEKIHKIMGTPPKPVLDAFKRHSSGHISFDFAPQAGTGLASLLTKQSKECIDLLNNLLAYNPDDRYTARQALKHPYFKDLYAADQKRKAAKMAAGGGAANTSNNPAPPPFAINPLNPLASPTTLSPTLSPTNPLQQQLQPQQQQTQQPLPQMGGIHHYGMAAGPPNALYPGHHPMAVMPGGGPGATQQPSLPLLAGHEQSPPYVSPPPAAATGAGNPAGPTPLNISNSSNPGTLAPLITSSPSHYGHDVPKHTGPMKIVGASPTGGGSGVGGGRGRGGGVSGKKKGRPSGRGRGGHGHGYGRHHHNNNNNKYGGPSRRNGPSLQTSGYGYAGNGRGGAKAGKGLAPMAAAMSYRSPPGAKLKPLQLGGVGATPKGRGGGVSGGGRNPVLTGGRGSGRRTNRRGRGGSYVSPYSQKHIKASRAKSKFSRRDAHPSSTHRSKPRGGVPSRRSYYPSHAAFRS